MPTAILNLERCRVSIASERLQILIPDPDHPDQKQLRREIPLIDIDRVIAGENCHFTSPALAELLRRQIPIQFFSWNGHFLGSFLPATNAHGHARLRQYQRTLDPAFALQIASRIVTAKLYNQRRILQRLTANRSPATSPPATSPPHTSDPPPPSPPASVITWLGTMLGIAGRAGSLGELRGYEGAATARYFTTWATFLPPEFPFERRSTRPPLNPVNACISFAATLLYHEAVAFLHAHGLDPALGLLHATEDGRWSLALDLIEPFRPLLAEALTLDLFSHQILNASHFEHHDGGCFLNQEGRRKFFLQYERRLERQFLSETLGHRTTLRLQLEHQAVMLKAALDNPQKFRPFTMN